MTACLTRRQLTCFGTLFHVKHSDDVTSDDFYMTPDNISDDTRAGDAAHDHSTDSRHSETAAEAETEPWIEPDDISGVRKALLCYRVMAYIVGTLLVVLVCVAMPLKYAAGTRTMVNVVGISHGWLYPILLITPICWDARQAGH